MKRSKRNGNKKVIRHKACASEFDYQAWKAWGHWRRTVIEQAEAAAALEELFEGDGLPLLTPTPASVGNESKSTRSSWHKDCWNTCDYPSECRWGRQHGIQTPTVESPAAVTVPSSPVATIPEELEPQASASFVDVALDVETHDPASDDFLESLSRTPFTSPEEEIKRPSMDDLLESAKRRKRRSAGFVASPLASNPPSPTEPESAVSTAQALQKAFDDFELDFPKSFGRAGAFVSNFVNNKRNTTILVDDKAEVFVKGLRVGRKKSAASIS